MECDADERDRRLNAYFNQPTNNADFSNTYFFDRGNASVIKAYNPDAKIVITTRRPSARTKSHFRFLRRNGLDPNISLAAYLSEHDDVRILDRSDYADMIERYVSAFGKAQVLVQPMELLQSDAQAYIDRLTSFLGCASVSLDDKDREVVLAAAKPRSAMIARLAKRTANILREKGYLGVLARAKDNPVISKLLFTKAGHDPVMDFGPHVERVGSLDKAYPALIAKYASDVSGIVDV